MKSSSPTSSWKHLFSFTQWSHLALLLGALLSSSVVAGLKTALSIILGQVFDVIGDFGTGQRLADSTMSQVSKWSFLMLGLWVGNWMANSAFLALWIAFGELQARSVRHEIFHSLLQKDMSWFDSQDQGVSSLLIRIQTQTRELQLATSQCFGMLITDTIVSFSSIGVALYFSWRLTLVLFATLPFSAIILSFAAKPIEPAIQTQKVHFASASKHATASLTAIDLVKTFKGYDQELFHYIESIQHAGKCYLIQARCNSIQTGYVAFWTIAMFVAGFWYGVVLVEDGSSPGSVFTTFYATLNAFQGLEALIPQWLVLAKGISAGGFLSSVVASSDGKSRMGRTERPSICFGDIELKDVSFSYPSNPNKVLNSSCMSFTAGEMTFLVGKSGSGKSTIGNLISNLYEPSTGDIHVDGKSMRVLDQQWIHENITLIQQSSILFNETLFQNVAFGHVNPSSATKDQILSACKSSMLDSLIAALPRGLDTNVGSEGHNLSGGQKQRLALARARLRDPPVLILDEVTSGLDQVSRNWLIGSIRQWRRNKTTIIITHDISQIEDDEFVYVMDNSHLVQEGLKRDLLLQDHGHFVSFTAQLEALEINILPASPTDSPITLFTQSRSTRMADSFFVIPHNSGLGLLRADWTRRVSQACISPDDWDEERKRFSRYISQSFSLDKEKRESRHSSSSFTLDKRMSHFKSFRKLKLPATETLLEEISPRQLQEPDKDTAPYAETSKTPPKDSLLNILKTVWPTLGTNNKITLLFGLLGCIIGASATPVFAYSFAQLLGVMTSPGDKFQRGTKWAIIMLAIAIIDGIGWGGGRYLLERVAQSWVNSIRTEALNRILHQPKGWFEKAKNSPGRINECLDRNTEEMRNIVGKFVPIITSVTTMVVISLIWALVVSWKLTLVTLTPVPIIMAVVKAFAIVGAKWEANCNKGAEDASASLTEIFLNIRVVKSLTLQVYFTTKYEGLISDTLLLGLRRAAYTCPLYGFYQSMNYPLTALIFYYGTVLLVDKQELNITEVMQVVNLLLFGIGTATTMLSSIPELTMAQATASQILGYSNMSIEPPEGQRGERKLDSPLPIRMKNVKFSYPHGDQVLRGISFDIRPSKFTAIVGQSGCGKSTVISILLGLYTPSNTSSLTFGGILSSEVDIQHLFSTTAYVSQSPYLFPASISENITYGLPESSPYRQNHHIHRAAEAAGIHNWIISLPEGYNTNVGDGGQTLSGGQAQRLSIARALIRQPLLLILDEPTSALDFESSETIRQTISTINEMGDMAIVMVTHSKEMMRVADQIVVLEQGRVIESGVFADLCHKKGAFWRLIGGS